MILSGQYSGNRSYGRPEKSSLRAGYSVGNLLSRIWIEKRQKWEHYYSGNKRRDWN